MTKLRISLSCVEDDLFQALSEAKKIMISLDGESCQIKVYNSWEEKAGHGWVTLTKSCEMIDDAYLQFPKTMGRQPRPKKLQS